MELDVVGFHPQSGDLIHLEPSLDALSWEKREKRYDKKFDAGRKYILKELFAWLPPKTRLRQFALFISHPKGRDTLGGGFVLSIDEFMAEVADRIRNRGKMSTDAIPEQFSLLRTLQLYISGYYSVKPEPLKTVEVIPPEISEIDK